MCFLRLYVAYFKVWYVEVGRSIQILISISMLVLD